MFDNPSPDENDYYGILMGLFPRIVKSEISYDSYKRFFNHESNDSSNLKFGLKFNCSVKNSNKPYKIYPLINNNYSQEKYININEYLIHD